ncbi:MAG: GNAT family N-acetyltransferase [Pirellulales bacterium]
MNLIVIPWTPTIRRYAPGEEPALWHVYVEATWQCISRDYHPDLCERWAPHNKDMSEWAARLGEKNPWVAVVDGAVVAFAELEPDGHIDYFYGLPEWQGPGIGKVLLRRVEEDAKQSGLTRLFAEVSITAKGFFLAQGFVVAEARHNVIQGYPAPTFFMEKRLGREEATVPT